MRRVLLILSIACIAAPAASARSSAFSCAAVPSSLIRTALGVNVGPIAIKVRDGVLYCTYPVNGVPDSVHVIYASGVTPAFFASEKPTPFHPHAIHNLGNAAYGYSIGHGIFQQSLVSVLKGSKELTIAGQGVPLAKATALARRLLPHI
jgi:hypothetical protein